MEKIGGLLTPQEGFPSEKRAPKILEFCPEGMRCGLPSHAALSKGVCSTPKGITFFCKRSPFSFLFTVILPSKKSSWDPTIPHRYDPDS